MTYVLGIISLFYIAYKLGKEDGKWGLMFFLLTLFIIGAIGAIADRI